MEKREGWRRAEKSGIGEGQGEDGGRMEAWDSRAEGGAGEMGLEPRYESK